MCQGFSQFLGVLHPIVLAKLATSSISVNKLCVLLMLLINGLLSSPDHDISNIQYTVLKNPACNRCLIWTKHKFICVGFLASLT